LSNTKLKEENLSINTQGELQIPFYNNSLLEDGAWVLLRIRRTDEYTGVREWFNETRSLRGRIADLISDFSSGFISKEEALKSFEITKSGNKTILDKFMSLRSIIRNDGVLTERESGFYVGQLQIRITAALQAIKEGNKELYKVAVDRANNALSKGSTIFGVIGEVFEDEVKSLVETRSFTLVEDTPLGQIASFSHEDIFDSMKYLPKAIAEYEKP
jgi:hypothetical protein